MVRHFNEVPRDYVENAVCCMFGSVLLGELDPRRARFKRKEKLGIAAKIETARAVCNLPEIIVRARLAGGRSV